jgi:hypothetical protein
MLAIEQTVTYYSFIVLDKERADQMVNWNRRDSGKPFNIQFSADFKVWERTLRGEMSVRAVDVDPALIDGGREELEHRIKRFMAFNKAYRDGYNQIPTKLKRWKFTFNDQTDAIMFKMKWL